MRGPDGAGPVGGSGSRRRAHAAPGLTETPIPEVEYGSAEIAPYAPGAYSGELVQPGFAEPPAAALPAVSEPSPGGRAARRRAAQLRAAEAGAQAPAREPFTGTPPLGTTQRFSLPPGTVAGPPAVRPPASESATGPDAWFRTDTETPVDAPGERAFDPSLAPAVRSGTTTGSAGPTAPAAGGRAARRKAQRGKPGRGGGRPPASPAVAEGAGRAARRRAAKPSTGARILTASARLVGELAMTVGVLLVLYVVYLTWWTNVVAAEKARDEAHDIQQSWNDPTGVDPRNPGQFVAPNKGFALLYIPRIGMEKQAIAEGTDRAKVLNNGLVGHYTDPQTAMPWDAQGNFAVAAHRNGHGEPFRYINKLKPGDKVVVETATTYFTYTIDADLPQTSPQHIEVIDPIPDRGPYKKAGRYITLTTCTPDGASTYRLIVWGHLEEERPRTQGKPDALLAAAK
ncbi:class E sortase [Embleya sp. NPDC059259]|uniref:class E sortase n=1 Tax=unclassified Embleya TaxID=2699296 RepID=UPI003694FB86